MEKLIQRIAKEIRVSNSLQESIERQFMLEDVSKNTILLKEQQYCRKLYYLAEGTIRTYHFHDGKDISSWFYPEDHFFTSWFSFLKQQQSFEYIEVLEDSKIYSISYEKYQKMFEAFPEFEHFGRRLVEDQLSFIDYFSQGYLFLSAKEKYDLLLSYYPKITQRIKLGHIASFLGITQETLSRIRRKA